MSTFSLVRVETPDGKATVDWLIGGEIAILPDRSTLCKACGEMIVWAVTLDDHRRPYDPDGRNHYGTCPSRQSPGAMR